MGVDAELYAAAAVLHDQSARPEPPHSIVKETPAHSGGSTAAGQNITQNGSDINLGTRQEGMNVRELISGVVELR